MTAPTPTALKIVRGTFRKDRANPAEPRPGVGGRPPSWLPRSGPARRTWRRLAPILRRVRVLTEADAEALGLGCLALEDYLAARADPIGWRRADAAWKRYAAILRDFGMTPSSRTRVATVPHVERDPLAEWMDTPSSTPEPPPPPRRRAKAGPPGDALAEWQATP